MILDVSFAQALTGFNVDFASTEKILDVDFGVVWVEGGGDSPPYTGEYEVTPTKDGFTLPTQDKRMTRNLEVNAIPYYEVSNTAGGATVYIGSADEIII